MILYLHGAGKAALHGPTDKRESAQLSQMISMTLTKHSVRVSHIEQWKIPQIKANESREKTKTQTMLTICVPSKHSSFQNIQRTSIQSSYHPKLQS